MGTSYIQLKKGRIEFSINEHSNVFDLMMFDEGDAATVDTSVELCNITPEELVMLSAKMLNVASYWMDRQELVRHMQKYFGPGMEDAPWAKGGLNTGG